MLEHVVRSHVPVRICTTRSQSKIFFGLGRARRKIESEGEVADAESRAVVDKIGSTATDRHDRPAEDVVITSITIDGADEV